ncbi:MAG: hypothetical protein M1828_003504 [Chrysothrix sp. TS-e1954]|nr:MAG: hypothetical protein M1828_003504 [Chrysothrix sp. TS-e1954]
MVSRDSGSTHNPESTQNATVSIRKDDWDRVCGKLQDMESCLAELKEDLRNINSTGMDDNVSEARYSPAPSIGRDKTPPNGPHYGPRYVKAMELTEQSELTGEGIYLGGGSVPALVNALRKGDGLRPKVQEIFGQSMLPLFGLDNESATYPFVSLFGNQPAPARISELRKVLPEDGECLEELSYVTYPAIPDIEDFEAQLVDFLARRRMNQSNDEPEQSDIEHMDSMSLRWVALLFATFASGVQLSSLPKNERDLLSQVYGKARICFGDFDI